jgi:alpha-ribazole phosphatase
VNLYLIRHTQTNVPAGICYGQTDVDTAGTFTQELEVVQTKLAHIAFTHCFSSPLHRCLHLAGELAGSLPVQTDDRLKELNFGLWEEQPWDKISETEVGKSWFKNFVHTPCPEGESFEQLQHRIQSFLNDLKTLPDDSEVLIVTHGGSIRAFLTLLEGHDPLIIFTQAIDYGEIKKRTLNP